MQYIDIQKKIIQCSYQQKTDTCSSMATQQQLALSVDWQFQCKAACYCCKLLALCLLNALTALQPEVLVVIALQTEVFVAVDCQHCIRCAVLCATYSGAKSGDRERHIAAECPLRLITCTRAGCGLSILECDMADHVATTCAATLAMQRFTILQCRLLFFKPSILVHACLCFMLSSMVTRSFVNTRTSCNCMLIVG
jgi:hypothetical protein